MNRASLFSLAVAAVFATSSTLVLAQDDVTETNYDFEAMEIRVGGCWFLEGTVAEFFDDTEDYVRFAVLLRDAETPVRTYVTDSLANSEAAIAMALRDFSAWYTYRIDVQNKAEMANRQIGEIIGKALNAGLNIMLPGSGTIVSAVRKAGSAAYGQVLQNTPSGNTDAGPYIEKIAGELADGEARLQVFSRALFNDIDNAPLMNQIEAVKFEYVVERQNAERNGSSAMTRLTPGSCTGQLLNDLGIVRPTPANFGRIRHGVLTNLMEAVLCDEFSRPPQSSAMNCLTGGRSVLRAVADSYALRIIVVGRDNVGTMDQLTNENHLAIVCARHHFLAEFRDCEAYDRRDR